MRIDPTNELAVRFQTFLDHIYDGSVTLDDVEFVRNNCSRPRLEVNSPGEWGRRGFDSKEATHIYPTNASVMRRNHEVLRDAGTPIALLQAEYSCASTKKLKAEAFTKNLQQQLFLAVGASVMLTFNLCTDKGLCNGATGTVVDMIWLGGRGPPDQPDAIIVDFGDKYTGDPVLGKEEESGGGSRYLYGSLPLGLHGRLRVRRWSVRL
jgi:hypothetical protein